MRTTGDYIYRVKLCDIKTARVISEKLNFIYVNLPKFKKSSGKLETVMDYWLHALINSQPGREIDEKVLKKDRFFAGLLNTIRVNKLNKDEMRAYRLSERDFEDMKKNMTGYISYQREDAKKEGMKLGVRVGIQQGRAEGKMEGRAEGRLEIALNALKRGYSIEEVSALTNLTSAEIDELWKLSSL
jgi:predicted transposase/invertase (TIGR01784 family)